MAKHQKGIILSLVIILTAIAAYIVLLFILHSSGYIVFVNRISLFHKTFASLGSSLFFFSANFIMFIIGCLMLQYNLKSENPAYTNIKYWDSIVNLSLALFFGIGVLYTAVGMMHAFQLALGNIDQAIATTLGPWGILQRLVEGGLLMALLTTIVGGAFGYVLRLLKFLIFGKTLIHLQEQHTKEHQEKIITTLQNIEYKLSQLTDKQYKETD